MTQWQAEVKRLLTVAEEHLTRNPEQAPRTIFYALRLAEISAGTSEDEQDLVTELMLLAQTAARYDAGLTGYRSIQNHLENSREFLGRVLPEAEVPSW